MGGALRAWFGVALLAAGGLMPACKSPSDILYEPPTSAPKIDEQGRLRVTFGSGADVLRGVTPDGRLLFSADNLLPFGPGWVLASVPPAGGQVREEAGVYRPAFPDPIGTMVWQTGGGARRVLALWKQAVPGYHTCPDSSMTTLGTPGPAPLPVSPVGVQVYALPAEDGTPIISIPSRSFEITPVTIGYTYDVPPLVLKRVRVAPAQRDVSQRGANPFGPALVPGTDSLIYSDGEQLWEASTTDTSAAPVLLGEGAYPAVSADGRWLAYARPLGLDSTEQEFTVPLGFAVCVETHVEITAASWEVVLRDIATGEEEVLTDGVEPVFDPMADRLVVRGTDLQWFYLPTHTSVSIIGTRGAFAPAISPDGGVLAFSLFSAGSNSDVYYLRIVR
jgi:hypothetical protein